MNTWTKRLSVFTSLTFLISWGLVGVFAAAGGTWRGLPKVVVGAVFMLVPGSVAIALQRFVYHEPVAKSLGIVVKPNRWWLLAWLAPLGLVLGAIAFSGALPGVEVSWSLQGASARFADLLSPEQLAKIDAAIRATRVPPLLLWSVQGVVLGALTNTLFALGEELGWRGFMLRDLEHLGLWRSSLIIGVVWGLWHAPIILLGHNYPAHPQIGVAMMVVFCVLAAPLHGFVRVRSGSVVAAALLHGTINAIAILSLAAPIGGSDLEVGLTGVAGFAALAVVNVILFVVDRRLGRADSNR